MGIITEEWKNLQYVAIDSLIPNLKKIAGGDDWNAGAMSRFFVKTLAEAGMRFITRETDKARMCGLSNQIDSNWSYSDIELAWFAQAGGVLQIYEGNTLVYNPGGSVTYGVGDSLEVQIEYVPENIGFSDNFNDNSIDPVKWPTVNPPTGGSIIEQNNRLELAFPAATGYGNIQSQHFDFRGRELIVDVPQSSGKTYAYHENYFQLIRGAGQYFFLYFGGGGGLARIGDNSTYYQNSFGTDVQKFRFRHNNTTNTIYLDILYNSGTWANVLSRTLTDYIVDDMYIQIDAGQYANSGVAGNFAVDNISIKDSYSGWGAHYYHTPFGGSRVKRYSSTKDVTTLFPLRIDSSLYHVNATIENVEYLGANWVDEERIAQFPTALAQSFTPKPQYWKPRMSPYFGGGSGGSVEPPVTQGQIYPRGIKS